MASSRPWPFDDDDDRLRGSVRPLSQADLQAILAHLTSDPEQLLAGTNADRPVVAVRLRASVGRPGGSAQARWRRARAAEWAAWIRTLPWRVAVTLGIGAGGGVLGSLLAPRLGLVLGGLVAVAAGWRLRFRASPDAVAWRRGAVGERRTARLLGPLERHGWAVLIAAASSSTHSDGCGMAATRSPNRAGGVVRGRPGRRGPARPRHGRGALVAVHGAQVLWGKIVCGRCARRGGQAPAKHASCPPGGAGARTGHRPGRQARIRFRAAA